MDLVERREEIEAIDREAAEYRHAAQTYAELLQRSPDSTEVSAAKTQMMWHYAQLRSAIKAHQAFALASDVGRAMS